MSSWSRRARPRVECRSSPRCPVRGAHQRVALARDAAPDPDAPLDALAQVTAVRREREARRRGQEDRRPRPAQVGGERQRPDDDARVENVVGVPDRLPLAERGEHGRAELAGQELAPGAAVAVLAAERPAVRDREVGGGQEEPLAVDPRHPAGRGRTPPAGGGSPRRSGRRSRPRARGRGAAGGAPGCSRRAGPRGRPGPRTRARPACRRGAAPTGRRRPRGRATGRPARVRRRGRARPPSPGRRPIAVSSRAAWSRAAAGVSPPASTRSQAPPAGSRTSSSRPASSSWLRLSTVSGPAVSRDGTAVAASTSSANPSTSRTLAAGGATSRSVTDETTAHVPSVPVRARATAKPRSGSSQSSA